MATLFSLGVPDELMRRARRRRINKSQAARRSIGDAIRRIEFHAQHSTAATPRLQTLGPPNLLPYLVEAPSAFLTETARGVGLDVTTQRDGGRIRVEPTATATAALVVVERTF